MCWSGSPKQVGVRFCGRREIAFSSDPPAMEASMQDRQLVFLYMQLENGVSSAEVILRLEVRRGRCRYGRRADWTGRASGPASASKPASRNSPTRSKR